MILEIPQGIIELDSEFAQQIGFVSSRFKGCSYLCGDGKRIIVSMIEATDPGNGAFSALMKACNYLGFDVVVPNAFPRMQAILKQYGYTETMIEDEIFGIMDLWVKA